MKAWEVASHLVAAAAFALVAVIGAIQLWEQVTR